MESNIHIVGAYGSPEWNIRERSLMQRRATETRLLRGENKRYIILHSQCITLSQTTLCFFLLFLSSFFLPLQLRNEKMFNGFTEND